MPNLKSIALNGLLLVAIALLVVMLPVILPIVMISDARLRRHKLADARALVCSGCGQSVGDRGVQLADQAWQELVNAVREQYPGRYKHRKPRIVRWLHAVCPGCSARFRYKANLREFVRIEKTPPMNPAVW